MVGLDNKVRQLRLGVGKLVSFAVAESNDQRVGKPTGTEIDSLLDVAQLPVRMFGCKVERLDEIRSRHLSGSA